MTVLLFLDMEEIISDSLVLYPQQFTGIPYLAGSKVERPVSRALTIWDDIPIAFANRAWDVNFSTILPGAVYRRKILRDKPLSGSHLSFA